jgi:hypothetical protein
MFRTSILSHDALLRDSLASLLQLRAGAESVELESDPRSALSTARDRGVQILVAETEGLSDSDLQFLLGAAAVGELEVIFLGPEELLSKGARHVIDRKAAGEELVAKVVGLGSSVRPSRSIVREGRKMYGASDDGMLSRREYEVAHLVARGMSNRRISQTTGLREQSVKNLVSVVMRKLDCENRVQVALKLVNAPVAPT